MYSKEMRDKIFFALQDKNNGSIQAIYARIQRYGTAFKTCDKRQKYSAKSFDNKLGLNKQTIYWRLKHGWTLDKALTTPAGKQGKGNDKDTGKTVFDSVLEA